QSSQARQSRWYCRNRWESRSVPFFTRKPLLETVKGFFRLDTYFRISMWRLLPILRLSVIAAQDRRRARSSGGYPSAM
ncbi:hypothetical protein, partial [uncultured Sphingobacterium sp.]|uniref:hypothetical protein n=1 Tax=uncultured Sphingobacterium sp. TaxID=182688 RepID=UPI0025D4B59E